MWTLLTLIILLATVYGIFAFLNAAFKFFFNNLVGILFACCGLFVIHCLIYFP